MSKCYWNEHVLNNIDEELIIKAIQYNQMISNKLETSVSLLNFENIKKYNCDEISIPSINIRVIDIENISFQDFDIQSFFNILKGAYGILDYIITIPVMFISNSLCSELFIPDITTNNTLIKFGRILQDSYLQRIKEKFNSNFGLFLLIEIDKSIALLKEKGYVKGIEQAGWVYHNIIKELKTSGIQYMSLNLKEQLVVKELRLNATKLILANNIFIKKGCF